MGGYLSMHLKYQHKMELKKKKKRIALNVVANEGIACNSLASASLREIIWLEESSSRVTQQATSGRKKRHGAEPVGGEGGVRRGSKVISEAESGRDNKTLPPTCGGSATTGPKRSLSLTVTGRKERGHHGLLAQHPSQEPRARAPTTWSLNWSEMRRRTGAWPVDVRGESPSTAVGYLHLELARVMIPFEEETGICDWYSLWGRDWDLWLVFPLRKRLGSVIGIPSEEETGICDWYSLWGRDWDLWLVFPLRKRLGSVIGIPSEAENGICDWYSLWGRDWDLWLVFPLRKRLGSVIGIPSEEETRICDWYSLWGRD